MESIRSRCKLKDEDPIIKLLENTSIDFKMEMLSNDNIINDEIRLNYVSQNVSYIAIISRLEKMLNCNKYG